MPSTPGTSTCVVHLVSAAGMNGSGVWQTRRAVQLNSMNKVTDQLAPLESLTNRGSHLVKAIIVE